MSHDMLVLLCILVGAFTALLCGFVMAGVLDIIEEEPVANRIFEGFLTAGLVAMAGIFGYFHLTLVWTVGVCALAICPGYFLIAVLANAAEATMEKPSTRRSSRSSKSSWKGIFSCIAFLGGIVVSVVACAKLGLVAAYAVAIVGAPFVVIAFVGMFCDIMVILIVIFSGGLPEIGKMLDRQAERIATALRRR